MPTQPQTGPESSAAPFDWLPVSTARTLSLPEQIAEKVGNAIIKGLLQPGARIQEQELADRFEVSRGPIREALRILEKDRMVQILPRRGARVTRLSVEEVDEIFEIRTHLIGLAVKLCVERFDPATLPELQADVARLQELVGRSEADEFVGVVFRMTRWLARSSGNKLLQTMLFAHTHQTLRYTRLGLSTERQRRRIAQRWQKLAEALKRRDAPQAREIGEQLAAETHALAVRMLRDRGDEEGG